MPLYFCSNCNSPLQKLPVATISFPWLTTGNKVEFDSLSIFPGLIQAGYSSQIFAGQHHVSVTAFLKVKDIVERLTVHHAYHPTPVTEDNLARKLSGSQSILLLTPAGILKAWLQLKTRFFFFNCLLKHCKRIVYLSSAP
jgi:hypothetical protein